MNIADVILRINPNARFVIWGNDFSRIEWNDAQHQGVKPTIEQCEAAWAEMQSKPQVTPPTIEERLEAAELIINMLVEV